MILEKCLFCDDTRFKSISSKRFCLSEKCLPYKVFYDVEDNNSLYMICFDIKLNNVTYQVKHMFYPPMNKKMYLYIFNDTGSCNKEIRIPLIIPYEVIITPDNFQTKLSTILTFQ